jgi:septum formation protein
MLGLKNFLVIPAEGEEEADGALSPEALVRALSRTKAEKVSACCGTEALIIAADTVVCLDGAVMGKPADENAARAMLSALSGRTHAVYTGVTVLRGGCARTEHEKTLVRFRRLTEREILAYIATGEPMDKAGAYGAQGIGALFVVGIEGDFFNIMGLPLCRLSQMLEKMGVSLI